MARPSAHLDGLRMISRRELSVAQVRSRLLDRGHTAEEADGAIAHLLETGALDDARVATNYAHVASKVKSRGRLRIQRELAEMGIARDVAAQAVAETFGDVDERGLINKAVQKTLRGRPRIADAAEYGRVYRYLMRQGFTPAAVTAVLGTLRKGGNPVQ